MQQKDEKEFSQHSTKYRKAYLEAVGALYGDGSNYKQTVKPNSKRKVKRNNGQLGESSLQIKLVTWARLRGLPLISIPNHGKRTAWGGMKEVAMGLTKGVSDLFLARPTAYHAGMWIELKAPGKRPTAEQQEWLARMQHEGYCAMWFDDFDLAVEAIERYLS